MFVNYMLINALAPHVCGPLTLIFDGLKTTREL